MFSKKKPPSTGAAGATHKTSASSVIEKSINFEATLTETFRKSERRAWMVAMGAVAIALLMGIGMMMMLPLKEKVPYLVMADPYTGTSTLSKITDDFSTRGITTNEALSKSNVAHFLIARESYDWDLFGRRDWNTFFSMADANVAKNFRNLFEADNPRNPDKLYGQSQSVRVKIKSLVLIANNRGVITGATVRFDRLIIDKSQARIVGADANVATMAFEYRNNLAMAEELRVENPLGFRVLSYRVDPETATPASVVMAREVAEQAVQAPVPQTIQAPAQ